MPRAEDTTKADLKKPTLTKEEFIDGSGASLKDAAKAKADLKQEEHNMAFREDLRLCNERKDQMEDDTQKAHALTMNNCCSQVMRNRIEEQSNFELKV